jgi:DNA-binding CsgD family transcriptional regulator
MGLLWDSHGTNYLAESLALGLTGTMTRRASPSYAGGTAWSASSDDDSPYVTDDRDRSAVPWPQVPEMEAVRIPSWASPRARAAGLTPREWEVLTYLIVGFTTKEIARHLSISPHTVVRHAARIRTKFDARSRAQVVARALGITLPEPELAGAEDPASIADPDDDSGWAGTPAGACQPRSDLSRQTGMPRPGPAPRRTLWFAHWRSVRVA